MEQFSLEEYLKNPNRKVITRDGRNIRIICTDQKGTEYSVLALFTMYNGNEICHAYLPNGKEYLDADSCMDLFFAPEKHEGWVNVYKDGNMYSFGDTHPYATEKEAKRYSSIYSDYVCTIKVEWED